MKVVEARSDELDGAFLVIGLPGRGLVGAIATRFLVQELGMRFLAGVHSGRFPPAVAAIGGLATSPVQLYASDMICGMDGRCRRLIVLRSEIALPANLYFELADVALAWAKRRGVKEVAVLEGFERGSGDPTRVKGLRNLHSTVDFAKLGIDPCEDGVLTSFGSAALLKANALGLPAISLFTETDENVADAASAAALLRALDPLVPEVDLKAPRLLETAQRIQTKVEGDLSDHEDDLRKIRDMSVMYV